MKTKPGPLSCDARLGPARLAPHLAIVMVFAEMHSKRKDVAAVVCKNSVHRLAVLAVNDTINGKKRCPDADAENAGGFQVGQRGSDALPRIAHLNAELPLENIRDWSCPIGLRKPLSYLIRDVIDHKAVWFVAIRADACSE